ECWAVHGAILPFMEQTAVYNSINFAWSPDEPPNQTVDSTQILAYLCPSDPNATSSTNGDNRVLTPGNNCYFAPIRPTPDFRVGLATSAPSFAANPTTGLFAFQTSKSIARIIDGTSNTIAFAESTVGPPGQGARQKLIGLVNVSLPTGAL